jgi:spore germination protein GerM
MRRLAALAVVIAVAAGACGVQADGNPKTVAAANVPYGLLEGAPNTTAPGRPPVRTLPTTPVFVYFVRAGRVQATVRHVTAPVTVQKTLAELLIGPAETEAAEGVRTAINPAAGVQAKRLDAATFLIDLSPEFAQGPTSEQVLGLAQIVFTATEVPGVTGVRFTLDGAPVEVPTPSGTLTSDPLTRDVFADLGPLPPDVLAPS